MLLLIFFRGGLKQTLLSVLHFPFQPAKSQSNPSVNVADHGDAETKLLQGVGFISTSLDLLVSFSPVATMGLVQANGPEASFHCS